MVLPMLLCVADGAMMSAGLNFEGNSVVVGWEEKIKNIMYICKVAKGKGGEVIAS